MITMPKGHEDHHVIAILNENNVAVPVFCSTCGTIWVRKNENV